MIDFLLSVPGKLKTISDFVTTNWTATRATKVDNLDASISSRAVASTALSSATWTPTRAAKLDGVIQTSVINSLQHGSTTCSAGSDGNSSGTTAITTVVLGKSILISYGGAGTTGTTAYLNSASQVYAWSNGVIGTVVRWTVVEFK